MYTPIPIDECVASFQKFEVTAVIFRFVFGYPFVLLKLLLVALRNKEWR